MAVDHDSAQTLTRFRFGRTGDRWKYALPRLRRKPIGFAVLDVLNIELVWQNHCYRVATSCPNCGALKLTADDTYALRFMAAGVDHLEGDRDAPDRVECLACGQPVNLIDLLKDWSGRDLDALLTSGPLKRYNPQPMIYIVDQPEPGKFWIGRTIYDALHRRVGPVFPLTRRLSRIEALDADHALMLVQEHHAAMTWREVPITPAALEPADWNWHGGPLAPWERDRLRQQEYAARIAARRELDAEIEAFRRRREQDLGL
jgi:hypothetical protein